MDKKELKYEYGYAVGFLMSKPKPGTQRQAQHVQLLITDRYYSLFQYELGETGLASCKNTINKLPNENLKIKAVILRIRKFIENIHTEGCHVDLFEAIDLVTENEVHSRHSQKLSA